MCIVLSRSTGAKVPKKWYVLFSIQDLSSTFKKVTERAKFPRKVNICDLLQRQCCDTSPGSHLSYQNWISFYGYLDIRLVLGVSWKFNSKSFKSNIIRKKLIIQLSSSHKILELNFWAIFSAIYNNTIHHKTSIPIILNSVIYSHFSMIHATKSTKYTFDRGSLTTNLNDRVFRIVPSK